MVACLRDAGLDKSEEAKSKSDLAKVHATTVEPVRTAHAACKTGLLRRLRFLR
jgi:hypothetical protein